MRKKETVYKLSDRYIRKLQRDIILNILITLMFYVVFNILFQQNEGYETIRIVLTVIFLIVGVAVIYSDVVRVQRNMNICYTVTDDALTYCDGKKTVRYPWKEFQEVVVNPNKISMIYPYEFRTAQGKFYLHKRLADTELLIPDILKHVRPYAKIDPEIPEVFQPKKDDWLENAQKRI